MTFSDFVYQPVKSCTCQTIINHLILIVYGFFLFFSRLQLRAHGGCDMSAVDAHSSKIAYPTSNFLRGATVLYFSFGLFILNTVLYLHISYKTLLVGYVYTTFIIYFDLFGGMKVHIVLYSSMLIVHCVALGYLPLLCMRMQLLNTKAYK